MYSWFQAKFAQNRVRAAKFAENRAHSSKICAKIRFTYKTNKKTPSEKSGKQQNLRKPTPVPAKFAQTRAARQQNLRKTVHRARSPKVIFQWFFGALKIGMGAVENRFQIFSVPKFLQTILKFLIQFLLHARGANPDPYGIEWAPWGIALKFFRVRNFLDGDSVASYKN